MKKQTKVDFAHERVGGVEQRLSDLEWRVASRLETAPTPKPKFEPGFWSFAGVGVFGATVLAGVVTVCVRFPHVGAVFGWFVLFVVTAIVLGVAAACIHEDL